MMFKNIHNFYIIFNEHTILPIKTLTLINLIPVKGKAAHIDLQRK